MGYEGWSKNDLIEYSNGITGRLRELNTNFEQLLKERDSVDNEIRRRLLEVKE